MNEVDSLWLSFDFIAINVIITTIAAIFDVLKTIKE